MKKAMLDFADRLLSGEQMKKVRGGCGTTGSTPCTLKCDQNSTVTKSVANCNRETVQKECSDLSKTVCTC